MSYPELQAYTVHKRNLAMNIQRLAQLGMMLGGGAPPAAGETTTTTAPA